MGSFFLLRWWWWWWWEVEEEEEEEEGFLLLLACLWGLWCVWVVWVGRLDVVLVALVLPVLLLLLELVMLSGELGQVLWGEMGGVGGRGGRSAVVSFRTCVRGEMPSLEPCDVKLKGFSDCISADGGGVVWLDMPVGWLQRLSSRLAASLRMLGGISSSMLKLAASPDPVHSCKTSINTVSKLPTNLTLTIYSTCSVFNLNFQLAYYKMHQFAACIPWCSYLLPLLPSQETQSRGKTPSRVYFGSRWRCSATGATSFGSRLLQLMQPSLQNTHVCAISVSFCKHDYEAWKLSSDCESLFSSAFCLRIPRQLELWHIDEALWSLLAFVRNWPIGLQRCTRCLIWSAVFLVTRAASYIKILVTVLCHTLINEIIVTFFNGEYSLSWL